MENLATENVAAENVAAENVAAENVAAENVATFSGGADLVGISPHHIAAALSELWSPRVLAEFDESYVKVAKVCGSLAWHSHEGEDELFLVLQGRLRIEMAHGAVELAAGEMYVVPKGVMHNPVAQQECLIMLIEKKSTLHTGSTVHEKTRTIAQQLRPLDHA